MKTKRYTKIILIVIISILLAALLLIAAMFVRQSRINYKINDDYTSILSDTAYHTPVSVEGIHFITQKITCGYAIIEMLAEWKGENLTEQTLLEANNGTISTAMGTGFLNEVSKQFPAWNVVRHINLTNSELLAAMYETLAAGMPVPIEFAALRDTDEGKVWTLHFAIVTGMNLLKDTVTVQNPYGYEEIYTINDFLKATRYDSYENMELFLKFGFAFGVFHKNTIYTIQNRP